MMRALYHLARAVSADKGSDQSLSEIVDVVEPGSLLICLNLKTQPDGKVALVDPSQPFELVGEAMKDKNALYGYKRKSSQGANYTPTSEITFNPQKDSSEKVTTLDMRLLGFYRTYEDDDPSILAVKEFLSNKERVAELRQQFYELMSEITSQPAKTKGAKKTKVKQYLTLKIDGKFPGERPEYQLLLEEAVTGSMGEGRSAGNGQCSLTLNSNVTVYGRGGRYFPFYTIDKPGMIVGGFREEGAWKNFPVSQAGGQALKQAREYLNTHQNFRMPGNFRYWVIPKFVFRHAADDLRETLHSLAMLSERSPGFGLGEEAAKGYSTMEADLSLLSQEAFNHLVMTFLFYDSPQKGQLVIKLGIDDVPPSRLRQLILAQKEVAKLQTYSSWIRETFPQPKDEKSTFGLPIRFSFGLVWPFYQRKAQKAGESQYHADYLQFIRQLYLSMPPDPRRILRAIMETLEALYKNPDLSLPIFDYYALQGLCWVRYLDELNLWQPLLQQKGVPMDLEALSIEPRFKGKQNGQFINPWMANLEIFLKEHPDLERSPFLFGSFLLGCLVRFLLDIQSHKLPGTPFEKELKGLRLKRDDIPHLFSKTIAKLRDYDHDNTYPVFDQLISDLCLRERAGNLQVTNEEISAYFAFGLAQGRVFKKLVKSQSTEPENQDE